MQQTPERRHHPGFFLAGVEVRTSHRTESNPASARIGALWREAELQRGLRSAPLLVALYHRYASDAGGEYSVLIGSPANGESRHPSNNLIAAEVPAGEYLVWSAIGDMPQALQRLWGEIWSYFLLPGTPRRTFRADFELHHPERREQVEVWIGVD